MKKNTALFTALLLLTLVASRADASDPIDGRVTAKHRVADLTDLFAFPTPKKSGSFTVILDTYTPVAATGRFSDKVRRILLTEFPWLAAPDFSQPSRIKAFLSNKALDSSQ